MDRYIGLDAHASSCTVAVVGPSGRHLVSHVVETNAQALISIIAMIPPQRRLCLEEGALAGWLQEVLAPHVQELVVTAVPQNRGPKRDRHDAFALAEMLRIGAVARRVYKQRGRLTRLAYLAKAYQVLVGDDVRYYHRSRTHLGLGEDAPEPRPIQRRDEGTIVNELVLGELHHRHWRHAD